MTKFEYTPPEDDTERAYALVDDIFDVSLLRIEEGLIVGAYQRNELDLLGTLAFDEDSLARKRGGMKMLAYHVTVWCNFPATRPLRLPPEAAVEPCGKRG